MSAVRAARLALVEQKLTSDDGRFAIDKIETVFGPIPTWRHQPRSLRALVEPMADDPDGVFIVHGARRVTRRQHRQQVFELSHVLHEHGVVKGDRVAIAMRNLPEWSVAFWAAVAIGAVAVPLNAWWTGDELDFALDDSDAVVLVCDADRYGRIRGSESGRIVIVVAPDPDSPLGPNAIRWEDVVGRVAAPIDELPDVVVEPDDDATLLYTSGTTGWPKGALGTHRNICSTLVSVDYVAAWSSEVNPPAQRTRDRAAAGVPVTLLSVPLFHATGLHGVLVGTMARSGRIVMMHKWDAPTALELIDREGVSAFTGVPVMVRELVEHAASAGKDLAGLGALTSGGAATPPDLIDKVAERSPQTVMRSGYGLTESSTLVSIIAGQDFRDHPESVGVPIPICHVRIVDEGGLDVAAGSTGEILLRGSNVVRCYWNRPEVNAEAFREGWFHTGDIGRFDADGYLYVVDRIKDLIIRGGENISAAEVESVLFHLDGVLDVAVVPVDDEAMGEIVGAVIVTRDDATALDAGSVRSFAAARLAAFKVPERVVVTTSPLPRSAQGKILKRDLRDVFRSREPDGADPR